MQQLFKKVESTKPVASRGTSAEIYVVCIGYLAPSKIDPRLLDHRHLFAEYDGPKQSIDVLSHSKQKRNRSGYEDGVTTLYKECPAETFIHSEKPTELLGQYHTFLMDASVSARGVFFFFFSRRFPLSLSLSLSSPSGDGRRARKPMKKKKFHSLSEGRLRRRFAEDEHFADTRLPP
jgi:hypothetical protein